MADRRALLKQHIRCLDNEATRDFQERERLEALLAELRDERVRRKTAGLCAERELRCAKIAARRFQLDHLQQCIQNVSSKKQRAKLLIDLCSAPSDTRMLASDREQPHHGHADLSSQDYKHHIVDQPPSSQDERRHTAEQGFSSHEDECHQAVSNEKDDGLRAWLEEALAVQQKCDDLEAQRALLNTKRCEHTEVIHKLQSTETKLKFATCLRDRKRRDEEKTKLDLSTLHNSVPASGQPLSQSSQRSSHEQNFEVEKAMFAEVKPEDLITPRTPTLTHRSPAPSHGIHQQLNCENMDDGTATDCTDETDKIEYGIIEVEGSLASPYINTDEFLRLAKESDDALKVIAELERRVDEYKSIAVQQSVEIVLIALSQEMAMEVVDSEIVLVAKSIAFSRDKITALVCDSLLEGCLGTIDNSSHIYVKSEIRRESFDNLVALQSVLAENNSNPHVPVPHAAGLMILDDEYQPPPLDALTHYTEAREASTAAPEDTRLRQVWKAWRPKRILLELPVESLDGSCQMSSLATLTSGNAILSAVGTSAGSILLWAYNSDVGTQQIVATGDINDSDEDKDDEEILTASTAGMEVSTCSEAIASVEFVASNMRLVAIDDAGNVSAWDLKLTSECSIDVVLPSFKIDVKMIRREISNFEIVAPAFLKVDDVDKPTLVRCQQDTVDSLHVSLCMKTGAILMLTFAITARKLSLSKARRRSYVRSASKGSAFPENRGMASDLMFDSSQFFLSHHNCEVLFLQSIEVGSSSYLATFDRSGICAVWNEECSKYDDNGILSWHRRMPVTSTKIKSIDTYEEASGSQNGAEVYSRHILQLAHKNADHQASIGSVFDRLFESRIVTEVNLARQERPYLQRFYLPRWQSEQPIEALLEASYDNDGILASVVTQMTRRNESISKVLSVVPAANRSAFCVLEYRRGRLFTQPQENSTSLAHGDLLTVRTVAVTASGELDLKSEMKISRLIVHSRDIGTRLEDCALAVSEVPYEQECILLRVGPSLYVYNPINQNDNALCKLVVQCPKLGQAMVAATGSPFFVCTTARGLHLFDARDAPTKIAGGFAASKISANGVAMRAA